MPVIAKGYVALLANGLIVLLQCFREHAARRVYHVHIICAVILGFKYLFRKLFRGTGVGFHIVCHDHQSVPLSQFNERPGLLHLVNICSDANEIQPLIAHALQLAQRSNTRDAEHSHLGLPDAPFGLREVFLICVKCLALPCLARSDALAMSNLNKGDAELIKFSTDTTHICIGELKIDLIASVPQSDIHNLKPAHSSRSSVLVKK